MKSEQAVLPNSCLEEEEEEGEMIIHAVKTQWNPSAVFL
jgi:hypothetical protein